MIKNISNLGDTALYCDFGNEVNKSINSQVIKYFKTIKEKKVKGINNLTPSYNKLIISYDLKQTNFNEVKKNIEERLNPEFQGRFKIMLVPNVTNICYGRGVGYKIEEIILSKEIQQISATKIRAKMREEGKLK